MACESEEWNPSHWSDYSVRRFVKHVLAHAQRTAEQMAGPYDGAILAAQMSAEIAGNASRAMLNQRGVKTLGEV